MVLAFQLELFIEILAMILLILAIIAVASIFIVRNLRKLYRNVYKFQSKFDIELRKTANLMSKVVAGDVFDKYASMVIKEMTHDQKKELLLLIDEFFPQIDGQNPDNQYVVETHENLQEIRRNLDSKVLFFNHQITLFPFNVYAGILKMKKIHHYTHQ